jgi:hypothetical protein
VVCHVIVSCAAHELVHCNALIVPAVHAFLLPEFRAGVTFELLF